MRKITQTELDLKIERHQHYLRQDIEGWENMMLDLSYTDCSGLNMRCADMRDANMRGAVMSYADMKHADMRCADMRCADMSYADMRGADMRGADMRDVEMSYADMKHADMRCADMRCADMSYADMRCADMRCADMSYADMRGADMRGADMRDVEMSYADMKHANMRGADMSYANMRGAKNVPFIPMACPENGAFVGYKKTRGYIVELEIPADAKRSSATSPKCRCDKAKVLSITNLDGTDSGLKSVVSDYDHNFIYRIGKTVTVDNFDNDRWNECAPGIHFFINRQSAVEY